MPASTDPSAASDLETVRQYHAASKHDFGHYADGPMGLDWATQPDPFRTYEGAERVSLARPSLAEEPGPDYETTLRGGVVPAAAFDAASVARLFFDALALSAWKSAGRSRWALRVNPSSGNLHPTEGYFVSGPVPGLLARPSVCHYRPREHAFEVRATFEPALWDAVRAHVPGALALVGLTSIHWREAWKYGERAYRYCNHDAGHAIATFAIAAAALGWRAVLVDAPSRDTLAALLGVGERRGAEAEEPECLLAIVPRGAPVATMGPLGDVADAFRALSFRGEPNVLSPSHVHWPLLEGVACAARKPETAPTPASAFVQPPAEAPADEAGIPVRRLIHQRRSAVDFDGTTGITAEALFGFLDRLDAARVPFDALPWAPRVHLGIFVHRVKGLAPGMYVFARSEEGGRALSSAIDLGAGFAWESVRPRLFRLETGDARNVARQVSCHQDIAADGAFSVGMFAEFEPTLAALGPWAYPRLCWECGAIGQVLYLEAEACGVRGTGIGCFFDDRVHEVFSLGGERFQSLYHFTVGGPVDDPRLSTSAGYADLAPPGVSGSSDRPSPDRPGERHSDKPGG